MAFVTFYASLRHLSLADAVAIAFASPFLITALGRFALKEHVSPRQWLAIAVGFFGMLVIVRPGASGFHPAALLVVVCSVAYAGLMVLTRWMTRPHRPAETNSAFVFYMLAGQAAVGWLVTATRWQTPEGVHLAEMAGMGVLGIIGNYGLAQAFRLAPVATVAPFEYTGLIWAVVLGAVFFGDLPAPSFWIGAAIIVWAGLTAVRSSSERASRYDGDVIQVRRAARARPDGVGLAGQPAHLLVRRVPRPATHGLPRAARDQRRPREAGRGLRDPRPPRHGDPVLRAGRARWRTRTAPAGEA